MSKIIIRNESDIVDDEDALWYVGEVMREGKISNNNKQHCYMTVFENSNIAVSTRLNKQSELFIVWDLRNPKI
jgi:calcineurin-like phosphoesterase family protein